MMRILILLGMITASSWSYAVEEEVVAESAPIVSAEEGDSELQNMNIQEEYQEKQRSILDILFGKANDGEVEETKILSADELAPGEVEINESNKDGDFANTAQVKLIDKTLGKLYKFDIAVGKSKQFNEVVVRVLSCWTPYYKTLLSDSRALVEVHEVNNEKPKRIFHGWMFSSAPSTNLLEHSKFDITLGECKNIK